MKPVAIVTPWFGKDLKGGAEQQAWQIATRLAHRGHLIEVLTTCCRSFLEDWATNHYKAGISQDDEIKIRRFRVDSRDHNAFHQVNSLMLNLPHSELKAGVNPVSIEDANVFCQENINSTELVNYLKNHHQQYQAVLFIPYLYGPVLHGLPVVTESYLQPCLHDEVYAYLPQVAQIFHAAKKIFYNSDGEAELATQLYGPGIVTKSLVLGEGVEAGQYYDETLTQVGDFLVKQRFVLYLGRRDATKNVDFLVRAYAGFKQHYPDSSLQLVIAGPGDASFNESVPGLVDLGLVQESEKEALLANCLALFQPSQKESYSRAIMEAWFYGRPVVVHQDCLATAIAVENAKGGWIAATETEWAELFAKVDQIEETYLAQSGANGQAYARENAVWDKVITRYETELGLIKTPVANCDRLPRKLKEIHQLLPGFAYGDAISNHALAIRDYLRSCGYKSDIFFEHIDYRVAHEGKAANEKSIPPQAGLIYHHSIGCEVTNYAIAHPGSKCLIYHNITPAHFFLPYRPQVAELLEKGRAELAQLAQYFPLSVGDSAYNASELAEFQFPAPGVLPISINPNKWDVPADATLMKQLQDGKTNLLFVGRISPNKRQDDLLTAFEHYLKMDPEARLILIGGGDVNDPYYCQIINTIAKLGLTGQAIVPGQVNDAQLSAYYQTAHLFWSMSEHEGFCVPLVEAMWFDVPILAYKSSAVPETLDQAGIMFTSKEDLLQVAALAKIMVHDKVLRSKILQAQRQRRQDFLPNVVFTKLADLVLCIEKQ